jgi:GT2 family glycosyltransferase
VAIGVRAYKNSSNQFLASWSRFLLSGLTGGDKLLDMRKTFGEPHHIAANILVTEFLKTDCDSLLMVDDDMVIPPDALRSLRENDGNWDYDIVMGFCTFKTTPPHAVAYKLDANQPGMPERLRGEKYNALAYLDDNAATPVDAVGMAFTLIRREVFEKMLSEYGAEYTAWFDTGGHSEMEDMRFSRRCREHGFKMCVDTSAKLGHVGSHVYGWSEHQQFVKILETKDG